MFYSQCLLSKKGPLGVIWVAAHCHKRLRKDQVKQTDISSSVDTILLEVPVVTYRILGYLLLGVVRIFSKKVEFLFHDCRDALDKLGDFVSGKRTNKSVEVMRANESILAMSKSYHSIILPERFELDAFDLDILEDHDISRDNVRPREEIMLADVSREGIEISKEKYYQQEDNPFSEAYFLSHTPVRDVFSPCFVNIDLDVTSSRDPVKLKSSWEKLSGCGFSSEYFLEPMMFDDAEKECGFDIPSHEGHPTDEVQTKHPHGEINHEEPVELVRLFEKEQSTNKVHTTGISLEDCLEPMICETEKESSLAMPTNEDCRTDGEQIKHDNARNTLEEPREPVRSFDEEQNMEEEQRTTPQKTSLWNQMSEKSPLSINIDATLKSKCSGGSGAVSPEFICVRTPANKEHTRVQKKQKCLFDETIVIPNKIFMSWINDSSDLVSKRGKVHVTAPSAWRAHNKSSAFHVFSDPFISSHSVDVRSLACKHPLMITEPVEGAEIPSKQSSVESPVVHRSSEEILIPPSTPVTNSTLLRLHEGRGAFRPDVLGPSSSFESIEKEPATSPDLGVILMDEEVDSSSVDNSEKFECSRRARSVAMFLHKEFRSQKKEKGGGIVNLSQVLDKKMKGESARLFYEILGQ